jgi:hypothetical protein
VFKFYFWLDIVATFSIIPDMKWIQGQSSTTITGSVNNNNMNTTLKSSSNGARAGRILRIVRLIRLTRIAKLFKRNSNEPQEETNVGKKLSDLTLVRVIVIVLAMLVALPYFDGGLNVDSFAVEDYGLRQVYTYTYILLFSHL